MRPRESSVSPWSRGRLDGRPRPATLLFGRMHEDWAIEASLFRPGGRVLCIASAGCTAMALAARGFHVTAVDLNPAQVEYVHERLSGMPPVAGHAEKLLQRGRAAMRRLGWQESEVRRFLLLDTPKDQVRFWRERLDTKRLRAVLKLALHPLALRLAYATTFVRTLPQNFAKVLFRRLERGWATHPNRTNPYAWQMLLGSTGPHEQTTQPPGSSADISLACADAAQFLEGCPPTSFDAFTLSNILDGAGPEYKERLLHAVRRGSAPGAVLVLRSLAEPLRDDADRWAAQDRALIWGSIRVERVGG